MRVGTPTETKVAERRVGLTPASVRELVAHGHDVFAQRGAGSGIGAADEQYEAVGARLVDTAEELFAAAELIVKVKEPQPAERAMLGPGHILFAYLHLAPDPAQTDDLVASGAACVAYETVTDEHGRLPLLAPMSKVAGRMAVQAGANWLESAHGGAGILLGGVPGARAPHLVTAGMIAEMRPGSVVVDVAIDQGGCFETSRPTTHADPTYTVDGVVHYCVANMPGAVARTSAHALNNVTLPHVLTLADKGLDAALGDDPHLRDGLNVIDGHITDEAVAEALGRPYVPAEEALASRRRHGSRSSG